MEVSVNNCVFKHVSEIKDPKKFAQVKKPMDLICLCRKVQPVQIQWNTLPHGEQIQGFQR